jgi:predicted outer membrane repeat protein
MLRADAGNADGKIHKCNPITKLVGCYFLQFRRLAALAIIGSIWAGADASDLRVPSQYAAIQSALDKAAPGDRVLVGPGIYKGYQNVDLNFRGKAVQLIGTSGAGSTVLDCGGMSPALVLANNETTATMVSGFTIRNGRNSSGGLVYICGGSPTFVNCRFDQGRANLGGAVYVASGSPIFQKCTFQFSYASEGGGALYAQTASVLLDHCLFTSNTSNATGGAIASNQSEIVLKGCRLVDNKAGSHGGAIYAHAGRLTANSTALVSNESVGEGALMLDSGCPAELRNCTVAANFGNTVGGLLNSSQAVLRVSNSIFWGNEGAQMAGPAFIRHSFVQGGASGQGIIDGDPGFVDARQNDLRLRAKSMCIDVAEIGSSDPAQTDAKGDPRLFGVGPDLGAYERCNKRVDGVSAGADQVVRVAHDGDPNTRMAPVTVKGSGYDALNGKLSFAWVFEGEVVGTQESLDTTLATGDHQFSLQVSAEDGSRVTKTVDVQVLAEANATPDAYAGPDITVSANGGSQRVNIHGRVFDPDGDTLTYSWSNGDKAADLSVNLTPGTYYFELSVMDSYGAAGVSGVRVTVLSAAAPTLSLLGPASMTVECGSIFTDPGAKAIGANGLPMSIVVTGSVNAKLVGTYLITYSVIDSQGLKASVSRTVKVVDTTAPVITLAGAAKINAEYGSTFVDPGATAIDAADGTMKVNVTGTVNTKKVGVYTLTYDSIDKAGNRATATRTVTIADTAGPVIKLNGSSPMTLEFATAFVDPGATANDAQDGVVVVKATGSVNVKLLGTYTITYTATDKTGNKSTSTRTVKIVDTIAPVISAIKAAPPSLSSNGKMKTIKLTYTVTDAADPSPTITVTVTSSDPDSGAFKGDVGGDIVVNSSTSVDLREEVIPGKTRTYTITVTAKDASGNSSKMSVTVVAK